MPRIPTSLGREGASTSWLVEALRGTVMFAGLDEEERGRARFWCEEEKERSGLEEDVIRRYIGRIPDETRVGYYFDECVVVPPQALVLHPSWRRQFSPF